MNANQERYVLGWAAGHHDAAVALVRDDSRTGAATLVAADHAERWSRKKNDPNLDEKMLDWILGYVTNGEVVLVAHQRWWKLAGGGWCRGIGALRAWHRNRKILLAACKRNNIMVMEDRSVGHHEAHAWAAWGTSKAERGTVLVVDALGEDLTSATYRGITYNGQSNLQEVVKDRLKYPQSMGLFYSAWTAYLGFKPYQEEYHVMALATARRFNSNEEALIGFLVRYVDSNTYENWHRGVPTKVRDYLEDCLERCQVSAPYHKFIVAAVVQRVYELQLRSYAMRNGWSRQGPATILAGGCALNCVANAKVFGVGGHEAYSNPGDAGSAVGAALAYLNKRLSHDYDPMLGYGEGFTTESEDRCVKDAIAALRGRGCVAVVYGRSEFGPRALGHRSILTRPDFNKHVLDKMKDRVAYRPYGCVIDSADTPSIFGVKENLYVPYMNTVLPFTGNTLPYRTVTHSDNSTRIQTVNGQGWAGSPFLSKVLGAWKDETGVPLLLNTSLNPKGEPLARTAEDVKAWCQRHNMPLVTDQ